MDANHPASNPLREWRRTRRLTLEQAGSLIGVHGTAFSKYELGLRVPRRRVLANIIRVTNGTVTANDFVVTSPKQMQAAE